MKKKAAVPAVKHKVRIGIVGSKFAAGFHADSYRRNEHAELAAVAAIDNLPEFSRQWKIPHVYEDYKEMFKRDDIDLISVCVPNFLHHGVVLAAARAGKHIVCEKPFATSLADAEEMIEVCRRNGVKLFYAEDWVFTPALRRVEQVIQRRRHRENLLREGEGMPQRDAQPVRQEKGDVRRRMPDPPGGPSGRLGAAPPRRRRAQ